MVKRLVYTAFLVLVCSFGYAYTITSLNTDKSRYMPYDTVTFSVLLDGYNSASHLYITIFNLDSIVHKDSVMVLSKTDVIWKWKAPNYSFNGLMVAFELRDDTASLSLQTIAVDISADWTQYPRYGFLSKFDDLAKAKVPDVMRKLNRYHINGIQFYDWQNKHHVPLPEVNGVPLDTWQDVDNRTISFNTVKAYVGESHKYNMKAMAYNLIYGAWADADQEGVSDEWYIYKDATQTTKDFHDLPDSWLSDIYVLNPADINWQKYIVEKTKFAIDKLGFDGFHMDQLGGRGTVYDYWGQRVYLDKTFRPFVTYCKNNLPGTMVLNAVDQFGQSEIAKSPVGFLYTELWTFSQTHVPFSGLKKAIVDNNTYSTNKLSTVIAGYINYNLANTTFNTASVLFADAVIFAHGGSHLELGEHMLHKEYFPNDNVAMSADLENRIVKYYDFATAYERILCKGGAFETADVIPVNATPLIQPFPASIGAVAVIKRTTDKGKVFNFINFTNATTLDWRDDNGVQALPDTLRNIEVKIKLDLGQVFSKVWVASPDGNGIPQYLNYTIEGGYVRVTIPTLQYWTMLVMDNGQFLSVEEEEKVKNLNENFNCFPNPFNDQINLDIEQMPNASGGAYSIFTLTGVKVTEGALSSTTMQVSTKDFISGTYIMVVKDRNGNVGRKIINCIK